jgi:hypothetical protein
MSEADERLDARNAAAKLVARTAAFKVVIGCRLEALTRDEVDDVG